MDNMDGKELKVRCEQCRGTGTEVAGEGHDFTCLECQGAGFTVEVWNLKPQPKTLREQLETLDRAVTASIATARYNKEQDNG